MSETGKEMVKLERRRLTNYSISHESLLGGSMVFTGARKGIPVQRDVPYETYVYLLNSTSCFKKGQLYVVDEDIRENTIEEDDLENTHTFDEIKEILSLSVKKMNEALEEITSKNEKQFVLDVAKELKLDSISKTKAILKFCEIEPTSDMISILFPDEE